MRLHKFSFRFNIKKSCSNNKTDSRALKTRMNVKSVLVGSDSVKRGETPQHLRIVGGGVFSHHMSSVWPGKDILYDQIAIIMQPYKTTNQPLIKEPLICVI